MEIHSKVHCNIVDKARKYYSKRNYSSALSNAFTILLFFCPAGFIQWHGAALETFQPLLTLLCLVYWIGYQCLHICQWEHAQVSGWPVRVILDLYSRPLL